MKDKFKTEELAVLGCTRNPQAHTVEECIKCEFKNGMCNQYAHAKKILEYLTENAVVLPKVIYEDMKHYNSIFTTSKLIKQARKEMAQEFFDLSEEWGGGVVFYQKVRALAKQYGVKIK